MEDVPSPEEQTVRLIANQKAVELGFDPETREMQLESLHPGVTFDEVQEHTGFSLLQSARLDETEPPRAEELRILREEVDPDGYIIGR